MVLNGLNIKIEKTFLFLRNIILKIINNNNENNIERQNNFLEINKNNFLPWKICYNFPQLSLANKKIIIIIISINLFKFIY